MGTNSQGQPYPVYESTSQWSVYCKDIPFKVFGKAKDPAKRTWYDEHGDDEYVSSDGMYMEAYSMKVEFACKSQDVLDGQGRVTRTAADNVRLNVKNFLEYLRSAGMMKMYSNYTYIGRRDVRLESVGDNAVWKQGDDGWWFLIFEVTFKVNDPFTDIELSV